MITLRTCLKTLAAACVFFSTLAYADYAEDRALVEDLQARYLFAFDFGDAEGYAGTFAPDGVLNFGTGDIVGREAIAKFIADGRENTAQARANPPEGERPRIGRHIINNIVVTVDGDTARGVAYWTHMTSNETGYGTVDFFGHYEDEMVKTDGAWYFSRRHVYNEAIPEWASEYINPVTHKSAPPKERIPSQ
jgi:hypothetical protein